MTKHELSASPLETWTLSYPELSKFEAYSGFVSRADNDDFVHAEVTEFCNKEGQALLLSRDFADRLTDDDQYLIAAARFTAIDEWADGREDSVHGVEFGQLQLTRSDDTETTVDVAVKPYHTWRKGAANELAAMLKVSELTSVNSFEPLGIINNGHKMAVLTRFEPSVVSLDNLNWRRSIEEPFSQTVDIVAALQKSALTLARLHQAGIIHGDAEIKNMAVIVEGAVHRIKLIDLESAKWRDINDFHSRGLYLDGVYKDAEALVGSILKKGLWEDAGYTDKAHAVQILFAEPYLSFLRHPANRHPARAEIRQEIEERIELILSNI